jgi:hypothetical protein
VFLIVETDTAAGKMCAENLELPNGREKQRKRKIKKE